MDRINEQKYVVITFPSILLATSDFAAAPKFAFEKAVSGVMQEQGSAGLLHARFRLNEVPFAFGLRLTVKKGHSAC